MIPRSILILASLTWLANISFVKAIDIQPQTFQGPDDYSPRPYLFLKVEDRLIMLPSHSSFGDLHSNTQKTLWTVNYHDTSNFDGVDIVISDKDKIVVFTDLGSYLRSSLIKQGLLSKQPAADVYLRATGVDESVVTCELTTNNHTTISFKVRVNFKDSALQFVVVK